MLRTGAPPKASPGDYALIFEKHPIGALILEDLVARFGRHPWVPGGLEAQRLSDYRAGSLRVCDHILNQINRANGVPDEPAQTDER